VSTTRRIWRIPRAGDLSRLELVEDVLPDPAPGEVQVAVGAVGLNFADALALLGLYSATPDGAFTPGLEAAGVVVAVGPPLASRPVYAIGDRVIVLTRFGGYATHLNSDTRYVYPTPPAYSDAEAAAFPVQSLTAWYGIERLGAVKARDVVLVQSAAGGVGLQALAILKRLGAQAIAVVGSDAKADFIARHAGLEPHAIVVRRRESFAAALDDALTTLGRRGFDCIFDAVLGPFFRPAFARLAPEGRYVLYGAAEFTPRGQRRNWIRLAWQWWRRPRLDPLAMISDNRGLLAFNLIWLWESVDRLPEGYAALEALALPPPYVGQRYRFDEAPHALKELQSGRTIGKSVLLVTPP
jgi:synaptic vesicle membrane protein VAT-1